MKRLCLLILLFGLVAPAAGPANAAYGPDDLDVSPIFDLRVRQEGLDGVYHFAPDPDRNWIRVRTRGGFSAAQGAFRFDLRLANEHRHFLTPDNVDFDWDELIIDRLRAVWTYGDGASLSVGRQDIIWNKGFLMLEGHPLDGSRSIYHNAVRWQTPLLDGLFDLSLIRNLKRDQLVLAGDDQRALSDADETGLAARWAGGPWQVAFIVKNEIDPDLVLPDLLTVTLAPRREFPVGENGTLLAELAVQYQSLDAGDHWATAGQFFYRHKLDNQVKYDLGGFFYSAPGEDTPGFRVPWGRWPKWSELYIYTLIGESTPGRVTVAAWENIAAPRAQVTFPVAGKLDGRLGATYLLAPEPDWQARGLLTQAELKFSLPHNLTGHLLWEMLDPGSFHDGGNGLPPLTDTVHFLRWQITYALK